MAAISHLRPEGSVHSVALISILGIRRSSAGVHFSNIASNGRCGLCATERRSLRKHKHHDARRLPSIAKSENPRDLRGSKVSTLISSDFSDESLISAAFTFAVMSLPSRASRHRPWSATPAPSVGAHRGCRCARAVSQQSGAAAGRSGSATVGTIGEARWRVSPAPPPRRPRSTRAGPRSATESSSPNGRSPR